MPTVSAGRGPGDSREAGPQRVADDTWPPPHFAAADPAGAGTDALCASLCGKFSRPARHFSAFAGPPRDSSIPRRRSSVQQAARRGAGTMAWAAWHSHAPPPAGAAPALHSGGRGSAGARKSASRPAATRCPRANDLLCSVALHGLVAPRTAGKEEHDETEDLGSIW